MCHIYKEIQMVFNWSACMMSPISHNAMHCWGMTTCLKLILNATCYWESVYTNTEGKRVPYFYEPFKSCYWNIPLSSLTKRYYRPCVYNCVPRMTQQIFILCLTEIILLFDYKTPLEQEDEMHHMRLFNLEPLVRGGCCKVWSTKPSELP